MGSNKFLHKCGEILVDIKSKNKKNKIYVFQCTICDLQCDQLKKFSLHIGEEHLNDFDQILNEAEELKETIAPKDTDFLRETELKFEAEPEELPTFNDVEETPDIKIFASPLDTKVNVNPDPLDTLNTASTSQNIENLNCEIKYEIIEHDDEEITGDAGVFDGPVSISDNSDKSDSEEDNVEVPHKKRKIIKNSKKDKPAKRKESVNDSDSDGSKDAECDVPLTSRDANHPILFKLPIQQNYCSLLNEQINHWNTKNEKKLPTKKYKSHTKEVRRKIIEIGAKGGNWQSVAADLGIPYKTAYRWVTDCRYDPDPQEYGRQKTLTEEEQEQLLQWIEEKPFISLQELKEKVLRDYQKSLATTTISNHLNGKIYSFKYLRYEPIAMNNFENKRKRVKYLSDLNNYIENGKQIVWFDETNYNLYWKKSRCSWIKKSPNVCLMGAITKSQVLLMSTKRGPYELSEAQEWLKNFINLWQQEMGNLLQDLVIVCDHTLFQNQLEVFFENSPITLLRLAPFSSMLNPIEYIWTKIKTLAKNVLSNFDLYSNNSWEDNLVRLENTINKVKTNITTLDCEEAVQQVETYYARVLNMQDMPVSL